MAQSKISLDTAALRSSAAQVKGIAGNLENELHSLEQIIASTANAWEGSAAGEPAVSKASWVRGLFLSDEGKSRKLRLFRRAGSACRESMGVRREG